MNSAVQSRRVFTTYPKVSIFGKRNFGFSCQAFQTILAWLMTIKASLKRFFYR